MPDSGVTVMRPASRSLAATASRVAGSSTSRRDQDHADIVWSLQTADCIVQAELNPHPAAQLAGLQAAGAGGYPACRACPDARRTNIIGGTSLGGRSLSLQSDVNESMNQPLLSLKPVWLYRR